MTKYVIVPDIHDSSWCKQFFARFFFDFFPMFEWGWHKLCIVIVWILKKVWNFSIPCPTIFLKMVTNQISYDSALTMWTSSLMVTWELFYNCYIEFSFGQCQTSTDTICTSTKNWIFVQTNRLSERSSYIGYSEVTEPLIVIRGSRTVHHAARTKVIRKTLNLPT